LRQTEKIVRKKKWELDRQREGKEGKCKENNLRKKI
jgi:hypothetical protein